MGKKVPEVLMSIRESEEALFAEWRLKDGNFYPDGVVDEEAYLQSQLKLLFVLKEVNDPSGEEWDLREFIRDADRPESWNQLTRWVDGIRRLPEDIPWNKIVEVDQEKRRNTLRSIAVVNLKKSAGGHTTDSASLEKRAARDQILLRKQFLLYEPDLIICCGTSDLAHKFCLICEQPKWHSTSRGISFHEHRMGKYVVEYSHPAARCKSQLLYYGLIDAIREILISRTA